MAEIDFDELDANTEEYDRNKIVHAPFGWTGGKTKSLDKILPHLPYRNAYIEPFGGSGAVLLARQPSKTEVLNDKYSGITQFYRVIRNPIKVQQLIDRLKLIVHSREEFLWCRDTWEDVEDEVERAARWYYMIKMSFNQRGMQFARSIKTVFRPVQIIHNILKEFPEINARLQNVAIENQSWESIFRDYDHEGATFYCDPPYVDSYGSVYKHMMTKEDHQHLIRRIFELKGFVAVSGYSNPLYEDNDWDERYTWNVNVSSKSLGCSEGNWKSETNQTERHEASEVLWLKK